MNGYVSPEQILDARGAMVERYTPGALPGTAQPEPLETFSAASLAALPTPRRAFLDSEGLFPCRNVTMFSGDGGTGKSLLAMQLSAAVSLGVSWLGMTVQQGKALYISAEDDRDETHIRLKEICLAEGLDLKTITGLEIAVLAGIDAVLAVEQVIGAKIALTPLFERLRQRMIRQRPSLLVLDNLADIFAGNENVRPLARQFVSSLRALAIEFDCVVLLLAHPSLSGIATGSGTSGNTAWNNSVRSRLYLVRSGDELDPDGRVLQTMKANYGPTGGRISLRWEAGRFINMDVGNDSAEASSLAMQAERVFLHLVRWHSIKGINISPSRSSSYAPVVFARHPQSESISKGRFERAMTVLLEQDKISINQVGPPSKLRQTIVLSATGASNQ